MDNITAVSMENTHGDTVHVLQHSAEQQIQEVLDNQLQHQTTHDLENLSDHVTEIKEIVSIPKEVILISLVGQEQALYNPKHELYRNSVEKDHKWTQISDSVGWSETQCKAKWKALRDQYWRELKRSDYTQIKWKYFKELDFLKPFAPVKQVVNVSDHMAETKDIVSLPKELILISLVSQEPALYNPKHELYRNAVQKDQKWIEIAESVGWSETQCKAKWKALRDQYCREIKRSKFSPKANIKWKYFRELEFLRPFALARSYRPRNMLHQSGSETDYANVKEESRYSPCEYPPTHIKIEDQFSQPSDQLTVINQHQLQQDDRNEWNYVAVNSVGGNSHQHSTTDDVLTSFVQQISQSTNADHIHHNGTIHLQQHPEEEDDDPIHTFLNIESYFEKELITMIHAEDILYNSSHPNYRNTKMKLEVWEEIARRLKKTVKQCRLKWKALRDQYIREHKRLKSRENADSLPRWKHYDALSFLQKFIRHKSGDSESNTMIVMKNEIDTDMDDHITSSLPSPAAGQVHSLTGEVNGVMQQTIESGPHQIHQQQHQHGHHQSVIDCAPTDDCDQAMDISDYIIGDEDEDHSTQKFSAYHSVDGDLHESTCTSKEKCSNQDSSQSIHQHLDESHEFSEMQSMHEQHQQQHDLQLLTTASASAIVGTPTGEDSAAAFSVASHLGEDDEVGAFFRAVAMKIRNAKMTPIAFTDLQIDILRVINGVLKNH